jgi:hypothetical protein
MLFSSVPFEMPTTKRFFTSFFCLILTEGTFTTVFKDNKSFRSHKTIEIKVLSVFCLLMEGSGSSTLVASLIVGRYELTYTVPRFIQHFIH